MPFLLQYKREYVLRTWLQLRTQPNSGGWRTSQPSIPSRTCRPYKLMQMQLQIPLLGHMMLGDRLDVLGNSELRLKENLSRKTESVVQDVSPLGTTRQLSGCRCIYRSFGGPTEALGAL